MLHIWLAESNGNSACILEHFTNISWETIYSINTDKNQTGYSRFYPDTSTIKLLPDEHFPNGQFHKNAYPTDSSPMRFIRRTVLRTDDSPNELSPNGHFPDRHFPE